MLCVMIPPDPGPRPFSVKEQGRADETRNVDHAFSYLSRLLPQYFRQPDNNLTRIPYKKQSRSSTPQDLRPRHNPKVFLNSLIVKLERTHPCPHQPCRKQSKASKTKVVSSLNAMPNTPQNNTMSSSSLHTMISSKQGTKTKNQAAKINKSLSHSCSHSAKNSSKWYIQQNIKQQQNSSQQQAKGLAKTPCHSPSTTATNHPILPFHPSNLP